MVAMIFLAVPEEGEYGSFFPYMVFLSPNALFPLMSLFIWLNPSDYGKFLNLYMAGKIINVVLFFTWEFLNSRYFSIDTNIIRSLVLLGGSALICFLDSFSIWGAWIINKKTVETEVNK